MFRDTKCNKLNTGLVLRNKGNSLKAGFCTRSIRKHSCFLSLLFSALHSIHMPVVGSRDRMECRCFTWSIIYEVGNF